MPPQETQNQQSQNTANVQPLAMAGNVYEKRLHSTGRSMTVLGLFILILSILTGVVLFTSPDTREEGTAGLLQVVALVGYLVVSTYWFIVGRQVKKSVNNLERARGLIKHAMIVTGVISLLLVLKIVLGSGVGIGDLTLVLFFYLVYQNAKLK